MIQLILLIFYEELVLFFLVLIDHKNQKILKVLQEHYPKDFSIQEVADEAGFHRNTVSTYLKVLEAEHKVVITRTIKRVNLYSFVKQEK